LEIKSWQLFWDASPGIHIGELLLNMRGTYLKDGVETTSPERPLSIHKGGGGKTGLAGTSEDYFRLLKMATQRP